MIAHVTSIAAFPTADQVATAIVAASVLTGDDPVEVLECAAGFHARYIALAALQEAFPRAKIVSLGGALRVPEPSLAAHYLGKARSCAWWREDWVDDVVGALVANRYGAQAQ